MGFRDQGVMVFMINDLGKMSWKSLYLDERLTRAIYTRYAPLYLRRSRLISRYVTISETNNTISHDISLISHDICNIQVCNIQCQIYLEHSKKYRSLFSTTPSSN